MLCLETTKAAPAMLWAQPAHPLKGKLFLLQCRALRSSYTEEIEAKCDNPIGYCPPDMPN